MNEPNTNQPTKVCVIGAGASGIGLIWSLAMAAKNGQNIEPHQITLIHSEDKVGGHSVSWAGELGGQQVHIDCGVQMIAPKMYPATLAMLGLPDFSSIHTQDVPLRIASIFPKKDGVVQYWGNFPEYQNTPLAQAGKADAETFADLLKAKFSIGFGLEMVDSLETMLDKNQDRFNDLDRFKTYFLDSYMSIMNGYGNALLGEVIVGDVAPLWDLGYASFTEEVTGYGRFKDGADSWVKQMWTVASAQLGTNLDTMLNTTVDKFYPTDSGPEVQYHDQNGVHSTEMFDVVISTVDMNTNSRLMNVPENHLWSDVYEPRVGTAVQGTVKTSVWPLQPGYCALHQDTKILANHDGPSRLETLQFNGEVGAVNGGPGFDLSKTFSTYIESNLMGIPVENPEDDIYLTMYGYDPGGDKPDNILWESSWNHGMWLPTFMIPEKLHFHTAQGVSRFHKPHSDQKDTGIFFAGNNLTMDSEEGALMSGMSIAKYAFGIDPIANLKQDAPTQPSSVDFAEAEFDFMYDILMFPSDLEMILGGGLSMVEWFLKHWIPIWGPARDSGS